jgi:hypothetical protein
VRWGDARQGLRRIDIHELRDVTGARLGVDRHQAGDVSQRYLDDGLAAATGTGPAIMITG